MTQPMGMADFFTMEAGEYLERLDGLVSPAGTPEFPEVHRISRALRGSALMASQQQIAAVAGGLEALARAARDGALAWDEALRQLAIRAVDDLKVLVRMVSSWTDAEEARAQRIAAELEKVAGTTAPVEHEARELDAATRAFIAREGAAVGSALDQAARTLARNPMGVSVLDTVLRATQPLRGIASLSDLPPLPDLLDGIERAVQEMMRRTEPIPNPGDVFDAAARAVSRVSQEIATVGRADPDTPEAAEFARLLGRLLEMDPGIVPIETLYHADAGPHIVSEGALPTPSDAPDRLEMVSLGEHLAQAAEDLEGAQSNTQRQIRAHGLAPTMRALEGAGPAAARLVHAFRTSIAGGAAVSDTRALAQTLKEAGAILSTWGQNDPGSIEQRLGPICATILSLGERPAVEAPVAAEPRPAAKTMEGEDWLATSFDSYREMTASGGNGTALGELFGGPDTAPAAPATPEPPAQMAEVRAPEPAQAIAPITDFCYSGPSAMKQAMVLKKQLQEALPEDHRDLLQEIIDLVNLGLQQTS